jgi:hypothetical protein
VGGGGVCVFSIEILIVYMEQNSKCDTTKNTREYNLKISTTMSPPESGSDPDGISAIESPVLNSSAFWAITRRSVV